MKYYMFKSDIFNGHIVIKDNNNLILIDTGSPITIHISESLELCSETYICQTHSLGLTPSKLSEMVGMELTTLLGVDIISKYKLLLDYKQNMVSFHKDPVAAISDCDKNQIEIETLMGIPIIKLIIDDKPLKFFLDTGAKLSYLSNNHTQNYKSIYKEEDFYPSIGKFETDCFKIQVIFENEKFDVIFGNLPPLLQMPLMIGGIDGIIGYDFFMAFKILLDLENEKMGYGRNDE